MFTARFTSRLRRLFRAAAPTRKVELRLETLEDRTTPSVAANALFVASLYQGLLGRNADAGGLAYWAGQLNAGASRTQVAQGIAGSQEAMGRDVNLFYNVLLGRAADTGGLNYWMGRLDSGQTLDEVKAGILGSNEFFSKAGGSPQTFLDSLYRHELGRPVDSVGLVYWEGQLKAGASDTDVAGGVLGSAEAARVKTTNFYVDVLDRMPEAAGLNYWSAQLRAGVSETTVLAGMLGSGEYFARVQGAAAKTAATDPNVAAADLIGSAGLYTGPLPNAEYLAHHLAVLPPVGVPAGNAPVPDVTGPTPDITGAVDTTNYIDNSSTYVDNSSTTYVDNSPPPVDIPPADANTDNGPAPADDTSDGCYCDPNAYAPPDTTYVDPTVTGTDYSFVDPGAGDGGA
jgi:hypothetical protein